MDKTNLSHLVNLGDLAKRDADAAAVALIDCPDELNFRTFSHGAIDATSNAVARALVARGCQQGDRIAIMAANRMEYLTAYFGIMRAAMIALPINFKLPPDRVDYILRDADVSMVFADAERRALCPPRLPLVCFGATDDVGFDGFLNTGSFAAVCPAPDDIAMILYTSGSSGRPKGVPLTHAGQLWALTVRAGARIDWPQQRFLVAAPLFHMNALGVSKFCFSVHASMVLLPRFRAAAYIRAIGQHRCTWLTAVPTMIALVAQEEAVLAQTDLSSVQRVGMGSAPLTQALADHAQRIFPAAQISNGYGTTETGPVAFGPHPDGLATPSLALGYPLPGLRLRLVYDDDLDAEQGVLQLWTPALMSGYLHLPEKSAEAMTDDGYYISGDIMRRDTHGFYYFVGRADDMFVCNGENVYPGEVEKILERHPAVHQACVVPVADEIRGQKPVAFVVLTPGESLTVQQVKDHALTHAPAYQHPRLVQFVDQLPLAGTNKIDRKALISRAASLAD
ncbi:MAG: class I adenylate-forming enzyme family protein [bacterium]|nr:class I adenylate-forming enzyme family protein [bacterium]